MKLKTVSLAFLILPLFLVWCSKSPIEKGDAAASEGNYGEALRQYFEAVKQQPDNSALKEKIATAYFRQGEKVYERGRVIRAFEDRVSKGMQYVPDSLSAAMRVNLSDVYLKLALAYKGATPENPFQKKQYFDQALSNLETALEYDSTNQVAKTAMKKMKDENFQEMLDKGLTAYKKGPNDPVRYIAAEYYFSNALKLDAGSAEASRYLKLTRQKSLNLLDPGQEVPIAITDQMENETYKAFLVVAHNQSPDPIKVAAGNFFLLSDDGKTLQGKSSEMFATPLEAKTIANGAETSGVVAFPLTPGTKFTRLEFRSSGKVMGYKNLP